MLRPYKEQNVRAEYLMIKDVQPTAFSGCKGLTSVTIPNSVTYLWGHAFSGCDNLTEVKSLIEKPFEINGISDIFPEFTTTTFENATLYITAGLSPCEVYSTFLFIEIKKGSRSCLYCFITFFFT